MITGFNTDVEFEGVTYHVQTEDKGRSKPEILSLVYDRGTILASKRLPYDDLLKGEFDEEKLAERLRKQHYLICAAIRAGRIEELKQMGRDENGKKPPAHGAPAAPMTSLPVPKPETFPLPLIELPAPDSKTSRRGRRKITAANPEPSVDVLGVYEEHVILPDEAVAIVSEYAGRERSVNSRLGIELLDKAGFKGGQRRIVGFLVSRGTDRKVIGNAQILVKILGSSFRPQIFHTATDSNGIARIEIEFPNFSFGRAALLVRASFNGEEVELRRPISRG